MRVGGARGRGSRCRRRSNATRDGEEGIRCRSWSRSQRRRVETGCRLTHLPTMMAVKVGPPPLIPLATQPFLEGLIASQAGAPVDHHQ